MDCVIDERLELTLRDSGLNFAFITLTIKARMFDAWNASLSVSISYKMQPRLHLEC